MQRGAQVSSDRELWLWEVKILYKGAVFWVFVFSQANHFALHPLPLFLVNVYYDSPQPRWILKSRLLGEERFIMVSNYPLILTPRESFCVCRVSLILKMGVEITILYSERVLPLHPLYDWFLKMFTRDKDWAFTQSFCVHLEGEQEADCKFQTGRKPTYVLSQEVKEETGWL